MQTHAVDHNTRSETSTKAAHPLNTHNSSNGVSAYTPTFGTQPPVPSTWEKYPLFFRTFRLRNSYSPACNSHALDSEIAPHLCAAVKPKVCAAPHLRISDRYAYLGLADIVDVKNTGYALYFKT